MFRRLRLAKWLMIVAIVTLLLPRSARAQIGPMLTSAGPVDRSMGGAAVAAPLDNVGALYWNPATISALPNSMDFGVELLAPETRLSSSLAANSLEPGQPALAGSNGGSNGTAALPSFGLVYRPADSSLTFGLGMYAVAGFSVNYPASTTNPILTPQPPNGLGLGSVYSSLEVLQMAPTVSLQVGDHLAVAMGPTLNVALLQVNPLTVVSPNLDHTYPSGGDAHTTWGAGFQVGVFYTMEGGWQVGASFKSPQWFEAFHFNTVDSQGLPRNASFRVDLPLIPSVGVAYTGIERWLLAADFRYVDFGDATGLRQSGFDSSGAVQGLGWRSIFAMSLGAQYQISDSTSVRLGYSFNQNPIADAETSFNVASPTVIEHTVYAGASYKLSETLTFSAAYAHGFENTISGQLVTPSGPVAGSVISTSAAADAIVIGASVRY